MLKRASLVFLLFCSVFNGYAGHEVGGIIIRYESVAQQKNDPYAYVLSMYSIYDKMAPAPANAVIQLNSACYGSTSFSLPKVIPGSFGLLPLQGADYCSGTSSIQSSYGLALYRDTVVLPGICSNYLFSIAAGYGRYNNMLNMTSNFNQNYFEVMLNNTGGPNSSPTIPLAQLVQAVCTNKPLHLFSYTDSDADSLYFAKGTPLFQSGGSPGSLSYASGYSQSNQVNSSSGYTLNSTTGEVQTSISSPGLYLLTCRYSEYRIDTASNQMMLVGQSRISTVVQASSSCTPLPFELEYPVGNAPDSLSCTANSITVATSRKSAASSVTSTGSEFEVRSANSGLIPVLSASFTNDSTIVLQLGQTLSLADTVQVVVKQGTDNNTLYSSCGQLMAAGADTLLYYTPTQSTVQAGFTQTSNLLNVSFNASSSVNAQNYQWDFGDGSPASSLANPSHTYASAGAYWVVLTVESACGVYDTLSQLIDVCDSLRGSFVYTLNNDSVVFDASSSMASGAQQFIWDFGDGNTGSGGIVAHQYTTGGFYWVSLLMVNACGDSLLYQDSVEVCAPPHVDWTYTVVSTGVGGMTIDFDGSNAVNTSSFLWNFGDGTTNSTSLTPRHVYATPSLNYRVSLTVYNACGAEYERAFKLNQIGLEEQSLLQVEVYPNPSNGQLYIELEAAADLQVYNIMGQVVHREYIKQSQAIQLPELSPGMYYFELNSEKGSALLKHLIE